MESIRVIFLGTPEFSAKGLGALLDAPQIDVRLVVTQPDRPSGRGNKLSPSPVKELALAHGVPILQPARIKRELASFLHEASVFGPFDVGVVSAFGQILPLEVLGLPRVASVNIHASLLPRWRGAAPIQRAIMAGDSTTGVCLMHMDEGLDTGGVYSSRAIPIEPEDTAQSLHDKLAEIGANLLLSDIGKIAAGELIATPQPSNGITYAKKIENAEASIDWTHDAQELDFFIRGLNPWPGAFTSFRGNRLKVFLGRPQEVGASQNISMPGKVLQCSEHLVVSCGSGALELKEVQMAGRKKMSALDFLHSGLVTTNTVFGE